MLKKGEANHPLFNLPQFLGFKATYPASSWLPTYHTSCTYHTSLLYESLRPSVRL